MKANRKTNGVKRVPEFVARAERAFARVARNLRTETRRSGLPAVVFPNGKLASKRSVDSKLWACPGFSDSGLGPIPVGYLFRLDSKLIGLR